MKKCRLNEGLFKDIDKEIINVDDPDYEQKVKDQTFKDFQEQDKKKKRELVYEWVCNNVYIDGQFKTGYIDRDDENIMFNIDFTDSNNPIINIFASNSFPSFNKCEIMSRDHKTSRFNENGELPYKFGFCGGSFSVISFDEKYGDPMRTCIGQLHSFKNFPNTIRGHCSVSGMNSTVPLITTGLSTLPKNFKVEGTLAITRNMIDSVQDMPAMKVYGDIDFSGNAYIKNLKGWNPNAVFGVYSSYTEDDNHIASIIFSGCNQLESIADLPNGFTCYKLDLQNCHIEDGRGFPIGLSADQIDLHRNCLTAEGLYKYPFPKDLKAEYIRIDTQRFYSAKDSAFSPNSYGLCTIEFSDVKKYPISIPSGVRSINIFGNGRTEEKHDLRSKNCKEYFKWLDQ